eukprot:724457-Prorocentrum_minimum.AAC.1
MSVTIAAEEARNAVFYGTLIPVVVLKYIMGLSLARSLTAWCVRASSHAMCSWGPREGGLLGSEWGPYHLRSHEALTAPLAGAHQFQLEDP